jgi:hypothetical protein
LFSGSLPTVRAPWVFLLPLFKHPFFAVIKIVRQVPTSADIFVGAANNAMDCGSLRGVVRSPEFHDLLLWRDRRVALAFVNLTLAAGRR